jgi:hypothetical protein
MAYRTVIVVDGANNLIECQMNLTDYSQRGDYPATERFIDIELGPRENQALQQFILNMLISRNEPPEILKLLVKERQQQLRNLDNPGTAFSPQTPNPIKIWSGDMVCNRYSQKGIVAQTIPDEDYDEKDLPPLEDEPGFQGRTPEKKDVTPTVDWDEENRMTMTFSGRDPLPSRLLEEDLPIFSCPFVQALRKLDDMSAEEKQKVLDVLDMKSRLTYPNPEYDIRQRPHSKELTAAPPDSPLSSGWSTKLKRERSKLSLSLNGDEADAKNYEGCAYGNGNLTCPRPKKRSQIYCGHHLRLVSHKHQTQKALKRSRSSVDFGSGENLDQDIDYDGV